MAGLEIAPEEAATLFDRLDRWYVDATGVPAVAPPAPEPVPEPEPAAVAPVVDARRSKGARTLVRELVAARRRR